jgi:hypothetical protein
MPCAASDALDGGGGSLTARLAHALTASSNVLNKQHTRTPCTTDPR